MEITVTKIKTKDGEGKKGPWKLTKWTDEDGKVWSTFDKKARGVGIGAVVDIPEWDQDEYGNDFQKWTLIADATPETAAAAQATNGAAEQAKNQSIERQTSLCHILGYLGSLAIAGYEPTREELAFKDKAIAWGSSRYDDVPAIIPGGDTIEVMNDQHQGKTQADKDFDALESAGGPKTLGELLTLCAKNSINKAKFLEIMEVPDTNGMDVAAAYEVIKGHLE